MKSKLEVARIVKGYNQTQFAKVVGISRGYLCEVESGRRVPSLKVMSSISQVLELPITKVMKMFNY
jgi:DNA-binding XRE family transcriptional regulator